jgi:GNAT superfamily N-acetyltransferase
MPEVSVREAGLSDLARLSVLFDQYRQFQGQASDLPGARAFLEARLANRESFIFIAASQGQAVGFAQLFPSFSSVSLKRVFILNDLFVSASGRRQGIASQLLGTLETFAWSNDAARLTLNVARQNPAAQALYEARGWKQDAVFFMYHCYPPVDRQ